jgi:hypothetical protein
MSRIISAAAFREIMTSRSPLMRYDRATIKIVGEPWKFGIDNTPPAGFAVATVPGPARVL